MAAIRLAYVGGGSSRAPGTMASLFAKGEHFAGSEVVLVDTDPDRLEVVRRLSQRLADNAGLGITVRATTDRREGLAGVDAVLTSFRPGGFEARALDERIPLKHGVIGQETQGPGGLMMALRSVHVFRGILDDLDAVAPEAVVFNYTNPVNIVSQAVTTHSDRPIASFCEGPLTFPQNCVARVGLDPALLTSTMVGVNHNCWTVEATYDGRDAVEVLRERYAEVVAALPPGAPVPADLRTVQIAVALGSIPADYFTYYYFEQEVLRELRGARRTRSETIQDALPDHWAHYTEQAAADAPSLDPARSRGGIHELELALDAIVAWAEDTGDRLPMNVPNTGGHLPGFDPDVVVEVWGTIDAKGFHPEQHPPLPHAVRGITQQLAEYQYLAGLAAWDGTRADAVRAMVAHPFVRSLAVAEELYDELAHAHRQWLPERLLR